MTYCTLNINSCQVVPFQPQNAYSTPSAFLDQTPQPSILCSDAAINDLSIEIFRMGWVLGDLIKIKAYDCIGKCIQNDTLKGSPFFGGLQKAYNFASKKVDQLATCSNKRLSSAIEKSWHFFNSFLGKEQAPIGLRSQLQLDSTELGPFSDTPLVISNTRSDLPNVITPEEFKLLLTVYQSIKDGDSCIEIRGPSSFRSQVLSDLRVILATQVGRDLIYALHESLPSTIIVSASEDYYSTRGMKISYSSNSHYLFFGSPFSTFEQVRSPTYATLFHEAFHRLNSRQMIFLKNDIDDIWATRVIEHRELQDSSQLDFEDFIANDRKLSEMIEEYENLFSQLTQYHFTTWTSLEEKSTINRTNILRKELFMSGGDPTWQGRYSHYAPSEIIPIIIERLLLQVMGISDWINENVYFWLNKNVFRIPSFVKEYLPYLPMCSASWLFHRATSFAVKYIRKISRR